MTIDEIPVFIPTLGRPTLPQLLDSLKGYQAIPVYGSEPIRQIIADATKSDCEFLAIMDDDATPKPTWFAVALEAMQDKTVAFVSGPLVNSRDHMGRIVESSFLGSFRMRDIWRIGKDGDAENRAPCMGLFRRIPFLEATREISPNLHGFDIRVMAWFKAHGWKIEYRQAMASDHPARTTLRQFFLQKHQNGRDRAHYFRAFPKEAIKKPYFMLPVLFCGLVLWWPWGEVGLGIYVLAIIQTTGKPQTIPWFMANHLGYALGFLRGLIE